MRVNIKTEFRSTMNPLSDKLTIFIKQESAYNVNNSGIKTFKILRLFNRRIPF